MTIRIDVVGDARVSQALRAVVDVIARPRAIMASIGDELVSSTRQRIDSSISPDGRPFAPVVRGGKPLRDTGAHIYGALHSVATDNAVVVGVPYAWARVHQFGATIRAKNVPYLRFMIRGKGWVTKREITIPARPWLGVSASDGTAIVGIVRRAMQQAIA